MSIPSLNHIIGSLIQTTVSGEVAAAAVTPQASSQSNAPVPPLEQQPGQLLNVSHHNNHVPPLSSRTLAISFRGSQSGTSLNITSASLMLHTIKKESSNQNEDNAER